MLNSKQFLTIIQLQNELDKKIIINRGVSDIKTLNSRFLALLVELGEFANEQRCFKYWSSKSSSEKSVMLEEYIDSLHFILSIGNSLNIDFQNFSFSEKTNYQDLNLAFIDLFAFVTTLFKSKSSNDFFELLNIYFTIGKKCNFNSEEIISCYIYKNEINHLRQSQNY
ncbi:dUTP diphosphatase [Spiroplasma endosymbiont of Lasioglossum malachurum]|uniref:dUTP diphosphatase n=1 Tax=Spiroplasma endosymbiont of Lasioglossum malachurum TaxID=3066319 RepID=UPI0030D26748